MNSDVKSRDSVLPQDSLETVFRCLGLGLGMVSWVKKQDSLTTRHSDYQSRKWSVITQVELSGWQLGETSDWLFTETGCELNLICFELIQTSK